MCNTLWLIWKQPLNRRRYKIGILSFVDNEYTFEYTNPELFDAQKDGFSYFPGFPDVNKVYRNIELFPNINTRLPNPKRPDYLNILKSYDLNIESSKMDILTNTRGRLITDTFEFVKPFNTDEIEFDVAGTRHYNDINDCKNIIKENDNLRLELDLTNSHDDNAISVFFDYDNKSYMLGYVPRYYAKELKPIFNDVNYTAVVRKLRTDTSIKDEIITMRVKMSFTINR